MFPAFRLLTGFPLFPPAAPQLVLPCRAKDALQRIGFLDVRSVHWLCLLDAGGGTYPGRRLPSLVTYTSPSKCPPCSSVPLCPCLSQGHSAFRMYQPSSKKLLNPSLNSRPFISSWYSRHSPSRSSPQAFQLLPWFRT